MQKYGESVRKFLRQFCVCFSNKINRIGMRNGRSRCTKLIHRYYKDKAVEPVEVSSSCVSFSAPQNLPLWNFC